MTKFFQFFLNIKIEYYFFILIRKIYNYYYKKNYKQSITLLQIKMENIALNIKITQLSPIFCSYSSFKHNLKMIRIRKEFDNFKRGFEQRIQHFLKWRMIQNAIKFHMIRFI